MQLDQAQVRLAEADKLAEQARGAGDVARKLEELERAMRENEARKDKERALAGEQRGLEMEKQQLESRLKAAQEQVRALEDARSDQERRFLREADDLRDQLSAAKRNAGSTESQLRDALNKLEAESAARERKTKEDLQRRIDELQEQLSDATRQNREIADLRQQVRAALSIH
jgi:hypothetical protein